MTFKLLTYDEAIAAISKQSCCGEHCKADDHNAKWPDSVLPRVCKAKYHEAEATLALDTIGYREIYEFVTDIKGKET